MIQTLSFGTLRTGKQQQQYLFTTLFYLGDVLRNLSMLPTAYTLVYSKKV
jgi:hypothetical protein